MNNCFNHSHFNLNQNNPDYYSWHDRLALLWAECRMWVYILYDDAFFSWLVVHYFLVSRVGQELIVTLRFDTIMSALTITVKQNSPRVGLFAHEQARWAEVRPSWDMVLRPFHTAGCRQTHSLCMCYEDRMCHVAVQSTRLTHAVMRHKIFQFEPAAVTSEGAFAKRGAGRVISELMAIVQPARKAFLWLGGKMLCRHLRTDGAANTTKCRGKGASPYWCIANTST